MSITNLINRSDLLRQIDTVVLLSFRTKKSDEFYKTILADVLSVINEVEAVEAEPVRHGKWWRYPLEQLGFPEHVYMMRQCSECKKVFDQKWNYCPNCGAKMDNVKEKDEETEIWHSLKGNVEAPKGTFDKIYEDDDL